MGSLSNLFQRPIVAAAAVAAVCVSIEFHDKYPITKSCCTTLEKSTSLIPHSLLETKSSWVSNISVSKLANLSFLTSLHIRTPSFIFPVPSPSTVIAPNSACSSVLISSYQSAELSKLAKPIAYTQYVPPSNSSPEVLYRWHLPEPKTSDLSSDCALVKSRTVVVLLGWLGSKQKHLKRYAEWYTSRGYHAITFTFPMADLISYQVTGKAEQHVESLVNHLTNWLEEECGKNLVFHTFSNTGWLTYGVILEKLQKEDPSLVGRIKGCIVDSAPVAAPDPQVWASGFSAAFLKKQSVATKGVASPNESGVDISQGSQNVTEAKPAVTEAALLLVLEKFFEVVLNLPTINRRLSDVMGLLKSGQPRCPQLYIYSSADRVIPAKSVESFIEEQRRSGHEVRACNFVSTPHVDHFRNDPNLYASQLTNFLEDSVLVGCKHSS